jgi:hypothetical protein
MKEKDSQNNMVDTDKTWAHAQRSVAGNKGINTVQSTRQSSASNTAKRKQPDITTI